MGRIIPYIMENKKCLKPPTSLNSGIQTFREPYAALRGLSPLQQNIHIHICRCHSDTKSLAWVLGRLHMYWCNRSPRKGPGIVYTRCTDTCWIHRVLFEKRGCVRVAVVHMSLSNFSTEQSILQPKRHLFGHDPGRLRDIAVHCWWFSGSMAIIEPKPY